MVGQLERTGCIADYTHIWWDIRPHPKWGIEVRICDAVTRVEDAVAIAAYCQALVKALRPLRHRRDPVVPPHPDEREQVACSALWARRTGDGPRDRPTHPHPHREARAPDADEPAHARSNGRARGDRGAPRPRQQRQLRSSTRTGTSSVARAIADATEAPPNDTTAVAWRSAEMRRWPCAPVRVAAVCVCERIEGVEAPPWRPVAEGASARSASTLAAVRSPRARRTVLLRVASSRAAWSNPCSPPSA